MVSGRDETGRFGVGRAASAKRCAPRSGPGLSGAGWGGASLRRVELFCHVSSVLNRGSIRAHGLDWTLMGAAPGIAGSQWAEVASPNGYLYFPGIIPADRLHLLRHDLPPQKVRRR